MNTLIKCIYCLEDKPLCGFQKTEHVLPQSFGKFKNNFTLKKVVCDDCNSYFGNNLEIILGRDSFEGIMRFDHDVKKQNEFKSLGIHSRLIIKVNEGSLKGAYAYREYSEKDDKIIIKPMPQVGFKRVGATEFEYFLLDKIPDKEYLEKNFDLKALKSIVALGCHEEMVRKHLATKGISFNIEGEAYPSESCKDWECEVTGQIDQIIYRSIAKIAFNYLAFWSESELIFDCKFHPIRRYIRFGEKTTFPFVVIIEKTILGDEPIEGERRLGHIITLGLSNNKLSIVSQVSLFNWLTYSVLLAKDYQGKRFTLQKGHFYNIPANEILELVPGHH